MTAPRAVAAVLVGALVLTGCGSDDEPDGGTGAASSAEAEASAGEFPVTVSHKYGETTIVETPERVAVVGLTEQDALLALGVVPVGTTEWFGERPGAIWPWARDELDRLGGDLPEVFGRSDEINFESIAASRPDVILGLYSGLTQEDYERLSQVAPVVAQPGEYVDYGIPWAEATLAIGRVVGRATEAEAVVAEVRARFDAVREQHPEFEGATAVAATPYEGIFVYGPEDPRGRFLRDLGFALPDNLAEVTGAEFGGDLSEEQAALLDVDVIVWLDPADADGPLGGPLYETFPVHTEGREVFLDSFGTTLGAATSFLTPLSIPLLLDELVPMLAAAIDGDPATEVPAADA
jgi:iron complex transport system substrate-binding protein